MRDESCCCREAWTVKSRGTRVLGWLLPVSVLALMPKCPVCLAGYFALFGLGISIGAATYLRWLLLAAGIGTLAFLVASLVFRRARQPR